ncbi:hypothetical protein [Agarilytica rhodophyticola]|uniref:hypothetical protein n=1 Tax=Agarilytica rhodophyticola TaxID=1737490 RepID=UPI000B347D68|nr:hypothetical protein [Agarilytica rhodophyticola]
MFEVQEAFKLGISCNKNMELKSETEELWLLRHPTWVRWLGWLFLPPLFVASGYILLLPIIQNQYELALISASLFLGGFAMYMCAQAFKVFPYLSCDVEFSPEGFDIYWPSGKVKNYLWADVISLQHYASVQVLELKNNKEDRILVVTEQATSYLKFVEFITKKTGLKY